MENDSVTRHKKLLLMIVLIALAMRLSYVITLEPVIHWYDGQEYLRLARGLIEEGAYRSADGRPTALWPPGFPAVAALVGAHPVAVRLLHAVLGALTVLLGYGIARRFHNQSVSLLTAAILALYPLHIYATGTYSNVVLLVMLVAALCWLALSTASEGSVRKALGVGAFGGAAVLTTATMLPVVVVTLFWLLLEVPGRQGRRLAAVALVPAIIIVGAWTLHNYNASGSFVPVTSNGGYNLWLGNFPGTEATTGNRELPGREEARAVLQAEHIGEVEVDRAFYRDAIGFIMDDPGTFVVRSLSKAANLWRLYPSPMTVSLSTTQKMVSLLSYGVLLPFGIAWLIIELRRRREARLVLLMFIALTLVHAVFISKVRFRLPLDTLLVVMAAGGIASLAQRLGWRKLQDR